MKEEMNKIIDTGDRLQSEKLSLQEQLNKKESENEELKKQLTEANEKFTKAEKMFSVISHDLRSPFQGLLGYLDLIREEINDKSYSEEDLKKQLEIVNVSANRLFDLTTNVLSWSKKTMEGANIELSEVNLKSEVEDIFGFLKINALSKKIELINNIDIDLTILNDKEAINTILRNLISNAIKFTPQDGKIKISSVQINNEIRIIVEDSGVGIESDRLDKVFNMKETTTGTNKEQGNGLGLYLCKEIVEKLGGTISVESAEGHGAKFTVSLPVEDNQ